MIFAGGMPRASYGDRFTVSIMQGDLHVVLDFTSKVIDFVTLCKGDDHTDINGELCLVSCWDHSSTPIKCIKPFRLPCFSYT